MAGKWIRSIVLAGAFIAVLAVGSSETAVAQQYDPPGRVARLRYVQGAVSFQPAGEADWIAGTVNRPMTTGDKIWADAGARAELSIGSATIRLNSNTGFSFLNLDDRTVQLQVTAGTVDVGVRRLHRDEVFEVDTPNQAFSVLEPGQYRVEASEDGNSTYVNVRSGAGESTGGGQTFSVHAGERATFTGTDNINANIVSVAAPDDFDRWSDSRNRHDDQSRSARYVSPDVVGYEDLDDNGSWRDDPSYGHVWAPRVQVGWAPYHEGHWAWISPWGWTWVDDAPWGYAPFHYGRWVHARSDWCWVPGPIAVEPVYAPALVAFIGGGGFGVAIGVGQGGFGGNIGWFPLGPREVYVPGYNVSREYVNRVNISNTTVNTTTITNVYNTQITNNNTTNVNTTNIKYVNKTVPGAVTAVPQNAFVSAQPVAKAAVAVNPQQIASAPVTPRAAVAPVKNSVLGPAASTANRVPQPPPAVASRPVVAKTPPPPPPVPFEKQQQALAAHPGQPLAAHEVQSLRTANAVPAPQVRQAPPGKLATPTRNGPVAQSSARAPNIPATAPAPNSAASAPSNPPMRSDRPTAQPNRTAPLPNAPAPNNSAARNNAPPANAPANRPGNTPPANNRANPSANSNAPVRNDRPPSAQPNNSRPSAAAANPKLNDPRIDAYRGRPTPQQGPTRQPSAPPQTQNRPPVTSQAPQSRPAAPAQQNQPPAPSIQSHPAPVVRESAPPANRATAPQPAARQAPPPPSRPADRPSSSAFKVNKSPIDTNAASQRGQASRAQAAPPRPAPQQSRPAPQPARPAPRAANPQDKKPTEKPR